MSALTERLIQLRDRLPDQADRDTLADAINALTPIDVVQCPICGDEYVLPQDGDPTRRCPTCGSPAKPYGEGPGERLKEAARQLSEEWEDGR